MKIATVTTLNASIEDTLSFVYYHLNIGVDHMYLFFDNPNDNAIPLLSKHTNISCIKCDEQHWQKVGCTKTSNIEVRQTLNADLALKWCQQNEINWIAHIDVDELVFAEKDSLKDLLASISNEISYLSIQPYEAIPESTECHNPFKEITNFKVLIRDKNTLDMFPKKDTVLYQNEYFRSHLSGKSFTRISKNLKSLNIHKPTAVNPELLIESSHNKIFLLHYDCYNYENWLKKWLRRYDGTAKFHGRKNRNDQFSDFCKAYKENDKSGLIGLYERMYLISTDTLAKLKAINAVKTISLDKELFDSLL